MAALAPYALLVRLQDPANRSLPLDELKHAVRREKNKLAAAISRAEQTHYTMELEQLHAHPRTFASGIMLASVG